jgi:membrane-bound ClpP family serine protease
LEIPRPVWLWILAIVLIVIHATNPTLPLGISLVGFFLAVAGIVLALWEEDQAADG